MLVGFVVRIHFCSSRYSKGLRVKLMTSVAKRRHESVGNNTNNNNNISKRSFYFICKEMARTESLCSLNIKIISAEKRKKENILWRHFCCFCCECVSGLHMKSWNDIRNEMKCLQRFQKTNFFHEFMCMSISFTEV